METRARYILIGSFMLAVIAAIFGFIYWLESSGGFSTRTAYRIQFDTPVYGLYVGSPVLYNGVRAGEVTSLVLDEKAPQRVMVGMAVDGDIPLREDTKVSIAAQGLTGATAIALTGGSESAAPLKAENGQPPILVAPPHAGEDWTQAARNTLQEAEGMLSENREPLKSLIGNLDTFSKALSDNSDKITSVIDGLQSFVGTGEEPAKPALFGLSAAEDFPAPSGTPDWQMVIPEPSSLLSSGTERLTLIAANGERSDVDGAQWTDGATTLIQEALIKSFENAGYLKAVSRPADMLDAEFQLETNISRFAIVETDEGPRAEIDFVAKVMRSSGEIVGAKDFKQSIAIASSSGPDTAQGLNKGFQAILKQLVPWTVETIESAPKEAPAPEGDEMAP